MPARPTNFRQGVPSPPRRRPSSHASHSHSPHLPVSSETSAGGIVVDVVDGIPYAALIARRNRAGRIEWCLPKGHLEAGETPEQCIVREIKEELATIQEGENLKISLNVKFLVDYISIIGGKVTELKLLNSKSSVVVKDEADDKSVYFTMPLALRE